MLTDEERKTLVAYGVQFGLNQQKSVNNKRIMLIPLVSRGLDNAASRAPK